jgi:hypothetical protein
LPYFETINGETHHRKRYDNTISMSVYFYGGMTDAEKETAKKIVQANGVNFCAQKSDVSFYNKIDDIWGVLP